MSDTQKSGRITVLQVVDGFRMGGAETKLAELVERLDGNKFQSLIANVGPSGPLAGRFAKIGVPIFDCQRRHRFDLKPIWTLRQIMKAHRVDIVQNTLFWADFVGTYAARMAGVPVVLSWETVSHEGNPYHDKWQRRVGYKLAMRSVDAVIAVSHEIKDSLMRRRGLSADKIHVIHYGVDLEKFAPDGKFHQKRQELGLDDEDVVVGIVARLEEVKGHRFYIEAFRQIAAQFPKVKTLLVGDGSCRLELEQMVKASGLQDQIRFLGIRNDVNAVLCAFDVFVLPSITGEGLPNVVLEAMASGKPVVATIVGGTPEAVHQGENGFLVPPKDPAALATALRELLSDKASILRLGENSRSIAEKEFSLQQQIDSFEKLYTEFYNHKITRDRKG